MTIRQHDSQASERFRGNNQINAAVFANQGHKIQIQKNIRDQHKPLTHEEW